MSDAPNCTHRQFTEHQSYCPDCGLSRAEALVAACDRFMKDGETPAECIARNRRDVNGCLTMLIDERRKAEALRSRLAEAESVLKFVRPYVQDHPIQRDRIDAFLAPDRSGTKRAYHETHEPPHCPTCDCAPDSASDDTALEPGEEWWMDVAGVPVKLDEWEPGAKKRKADQPKDAGK